MTDMEMLEFAAKAIGERLVPFEKLPILDIEGTPFWNPRSDSKDALELAARLQVDIRHGSTAVVARCGSHIAVAERDEEDPYEALRMAIFRVAVAVGRGMP